MLKLSNILAISGGFRVARFEKCILEIALAAINDMKRDDNVSKRNEWVWDFSIKCWLNFGKTQWALRTNDIINLSEK